MVGNVSGINGPTVAAKILPPKEDKLYRHAVKINGEEKVAVIEKRKDGTVIINVPKENGEIETTVTDEKGLMKFEQKYVPKPILYSKNTKAENTEEQKKRAGIYAQIMKNLAIANIMMSQQNQQEQENLNIMLQQQQAQQDLMTQQINQQNELTIQQMTTPGMGII